MVYRNYTTLAHHYKSCGYPTGYDTPNFIIFLRSPVGLRYEIETLHLYTH